MVRIQLTGFLETNNGKSSGNQFMDEQNACGVPQQFVDAKEEKIRKKMVDGSSMLYN